MVLQYSGSLFGVSNQYGGPFCVVLRSGGTTIWRYYNILVLFCGTTICWYLFCGTRIWRYFFGGTEIWLYVFCCTARW